MTDLLQKFWRWFVRPPRVTRGQWLRDLGIGLVLTPIMLLPFMLGILADPGFLLEQPALALLFGIPLLVGIVLIILSGRGNNRLPL